MGRSNLALIWRKLDSLNAPARCNYLPQKRDNDIPGAEPLLNRITQLAGDTQPVRDLAHEIA